MARAKILAILLAITVSAAAPARAQGRRVEVHFTPTARAQLAIWIEREDGTEMRTVRLTDAVAYRGIGNRPGALQMNSAWHWPYGRREGVLPVWAHRRASLTGLRFPRVIFAGRRSEGFASVFGDSVPNTRDDYFCLSWAEGDDALDTMTCASTFMSNKGRYLTAADVAAGYAEPFEEAAGSGTMRALALESLYPPRQDLGACEGCRDHSDVRRYGPDARAVMPELDAVTMATPPGEQPFVEIVDLPDDWPEGRYVVFVEANTEGDHAPGWDPRSFPTPVAPDGLWDEYAIEFGYAYRGQPSVVYRVPFELRAAGGEWSAARPAGYGDLHGRDGELRAMDATIADDPQQAPGSGADRLRAMDGDARVRVVVPPTNVCDQPDAPPECGRACGASMPCAEPLICGPEGACVGFCDAPMRPGTPGALVIEEYPERNRAHTWARMRFGAPASDRGVQRYEVRVGTNAIADASSFAAARPAKAASLEDLALTVPVDAAPGGEVTVDLGGLAPETHYWVGVRAFDRCNAPGEVAVAEITTTEIHFTTVSPCFVATAAYGTALDARIGALRRLRDRHLMTNAPGRALVAAYQAIGPSLAAWIAERETWRGAARTAIAPLVALAEWLEE